MFKLLVWFEFKFGVNAHKFELIFCKLQNFRCVKIRNIMSSFNRFLKVEYGRDKRF
jgi:hypothetical protein